MIGVSSIAPPAAFIGARQHEDLDRGGTRPLSILRTSRVNSRPSSISSQFLYTMLEVDLAFRHSVTAHLSNLHDEVDSYFDKLEDEMRRDEMAYLLNGVLQPADATSPGAANQNDSQNDIGQSSRDSALGWGHLSTEKVSTPPLRIQKRSVKWT